MSVLESFIPQEEKKQQNQQDNLCIRFIRKKYRCLLLWALTCIIFLQLVILVIEKVDVGKLIDSFIQLINTDLQVNTTILNNSEIIEQH